MCKNIGNIGYFQKNKKKVLSLVGVGLLSGSAVIGSFFPYQEAAEVNNIPSDKKFRIPPHPIGIQDKLFPIKPEVKPMALLSDGWVSVGNISGYDVKYRTITASSEVIYQILGTSGTSQLGFACICANINTKLIWEGMANSTCDAANPNTPVKLDDPIMGYYSIAGVPIPGGSCCKSVPRVGTTNIPGLPTCG
jgi:hypothetical protein